MTSTPNANIASGPSPLVAHIAPFVAWLVLMEALPRTAWGYAVRTLTGAALLLWCRPWRFYRRPRLGHLPLALAVGVGVFVVWIVPELPLWRQWPALDEFYRRWGIFPPWETAAPAGASPYSPEVAGRALAGVRLLGSALIIAPIEEYFWRGFLYRWLVEREFLAVDPGRFQAGAFCVTALLFGLEHDRWLVGIVAGVAYAGLMLRTRDLGAAIAAHVVTNLLLGLYVLAAGAYAFW